MITRDAMWVWSYNSANTLEDRISAGKWIAFGSKKYMERFFPKINELVDQGRIYRAKYSHKENPEVDPFSGRWPVLCVYADDMSKEKTKKELISLGIKPRFWKYDYQTKKDWAPGGKLYQRYIKLRKQKEL